MNIPTPSPTITDRVVSWLNPTAGLRRMRARAGLMLMRGAGGGGYEAGRSDAKEFKRYGTRTGSAVTDIHPDIQTIRDRSRDQSRNNPIAGGAISTVVTSTVGTGMKAQPSIDREALGLDDDAADAWEAAAGRLWSAWADTTECDIEDELTFAELQSVVMRGVLESGDVLRIQRFLWDKGRNAPRVGNEFGTKVQLVEADRVSNPDWQYDTTTVAGGVETDGNGRHAAYWVRSEHPGEALSFRGASDWSRIPARNDRGRRHAALLYEKRRVGQRRGVPYLAPVIKPLLQLDRYAEAELMAAVVSAMFTVFVRSEAGTADEGPLMPVIGDDSEDLASTDAAEVNLGNGAVVDLAPGEDIAFANPGRPNAQFDPFFTAIVRQIGVGLELPFEVLVKHFSSSYSASRGAILEAWKFFRTRRYLLVKWLCTPSYESFIGEAVARGMLDAPGFFDDPVVRRAYLGVEWSGDAMPQIDPLKEVNAAKGRVDLGVSTIDREAREGNGTSFAANHRQRVKEAKERRAAGLDVEAVSESIVTKTTMDDAATKGDDDTERGDSDDELSKAKPKALIGSGAQ